MVINDESGVRLFKLGWRNNNVWSKVIDYSKTGNR